MSRVCLEDSLIFCMICIALPFSLSLFKARGRIGLSITH